MDGDGGEGGFHIELGLVPDDRLVSIVRRFVEEGVEKILDDRDLVYRISMAAHELLENAARYTSKPWILLRVSVDRPTEQGRGAAVLTLRNDSSAENLEHLQAIVKEIGEADDPMTKYQEMMRRSARRRDGSGLGLIRIRAEGEMRLSVFVEGTEARTVAKVDYHAGATP